MIRVNIGKSVLGGELEEALIYAANEMEFSHSIKDWHNEEYVLNPTRRGEVYGGSKLVVKGLYSHFNIDFNREKPCDNFLFEDIIAQENQTEIGVAAMMLKDTPEKVESPDAYIQDYLEFVSAKLYENTD
ncbi:MAG: hypothetical protein KKF50_03730 [Nanoarchaeota archaeon]|nr:hypothetical protein [Nanoarchaeota archaeon]